MELIVKKGDIKLTSSKDGNNIFIDFNADNCIIYDRLFKLFDLQKDLQKRLFGDYLPQVNPCPEKYPITITSIIAELGEILENVQQWKDWKKNPKDIDINNLRMEIADLWHFVINLTLYSGMSDVDLYNEFVKKNKVNHERQDNKY